MDVDSLSWYVDAWSVYDGAAFATRRQPQDGDQQGAAVDEGANTVFVCVPDLQPVPVGRRSTALSACRRNFQYGLTSAGGSEIAFDDLQQVIELVRRGYLAGGLGPDGPITPGPNQPYDGDGMGPDGLDETQPDAGPGSGVYETAALAYESQNWTVGTDPASDMMTLAKHIRTFGTNAAPSSVSGGTDRHLQDTASALHRLVKVYVHSVTVDWGIRVERNHDYWEARLYVDWCDTHAAIGALEEAPTFPSDPLSLGV